MNIVSDMLISSGVVKLMSGKIKPKKKGIGTYFALAFYVLGIIGSTIALGYGIFDFNIECILYGLIGVFAFGYLFLISPYTQNSNNYYIKVQNENSFEGFELFYKKRKVELKYLVDKEGKFKFENDTNKLNSVSYSDGTKMSNFIKYRIINYFAAWLMDNNYLSEEVTVSFEEL